MTLPKRTQDYISVSNTLACMSNSQLCQALSTGKAMHTGIGGTSVQINVEDVPVFVKKIPLTDFEISHFMSSANLFNLPMCYQYGVGSAGFSAWRELAAHIMTTNWVLSGQCPNFPLLYSWRIMPGPESQTDLSYWGSTEDYLNYWENNDSIKNRITSLGEASSSIVLFLEHFPTNLHQQLKDILSHDDESSSAKYLEKLNQSFDTVLNFMHENDFLHMDTHFRNILADENTIYLSDFGLALSGKFDLSNVELDFAHDHTLYDRCSYSVNLLHGVLTSYKKDDNWDKILNDYLTDKWLITLPNKIRDILSEHEPIAEEMHRFYKALQKDKSTPHLAIFKSLC